MPSQALLLWQSDRMLRLDEVDAQCANSFMPVPPPHLAEENLRGYVLATVQAWRDSCDALATELDGTLYNELQVALGKAPW